VLWVGAHKKGGKMFKELFSFFAKWFDSTMRFFQVAGGFMQYLIASGFGLILVLIGFSTWILNIISESILYLTRYLDNLSMPSSITDGVGASTTTFLDILETANTFFPVAEMFAAVLVLVAVAMSCAVYGLVKSWVPTVSG